MASSVIVLSGDVARFLAGLLAAGTRCRGPGFPRRVVRGEGMVHGEPAMTFIRTAAGVLVGLLATASPVLGQSTRVDVQGGPLSIAQTETGLVNPWGDRKSVVVGKLVVVRLCSGGRRYLKTTNK